MSADAQPSEPQITDSDQSEPCHDLSEYWIKASNGETPPNAVKGGYENGRHIFVARAYHEGNFIPGKLIPLYRVCFFGYRGKEYALSDYEVLCYSHGHWIDADNGNIPKEAIVGGNAEDGTELFIGRAHYDNRLICGKVENSVAYIAYYGKEYRLENFQIFVRK